MSLAFTMPIQLASTVLASDVLDPENGRTTYQYSGMFNVLNETVKHSGPQGLFAGFSVSVAGIIFYRGLYFGLYDTLQVLRDPDPRRRSFVVSFLLGWGVTILAGLLTYPLDTIRCETHGFYLLARPKPVPLC